MVNNFVADQNQTIFLYESGTFANTSGAGQWPGEVQSCDPDEELNIQPIRFQGSGDRNVDDFKDTIKDYSISINKYPQDWRNLYFALGGCSTSGSDPYVHTITELNNDDSNGIVGGVLLPSVTLENSKSIGVAGSNLIRTFNGCVLDALSISSDGEGIITCDETWLSSNLTPGSGNPTAVVNQTTSAWEACNFKYDFSGTQLDVLKGWDFSVSNNHTPDHYSNGSCFASSFTAGNRDYEFSPTLDSNAEFAMMLYRDYFLTGSEFNGKLKGTIITGSRDIEITMSGCRIIDMEQPTSIEGKNEDTLTIVPKSVSSIATDSIPKYKLF